MCVADHKPLFRQSGETNSETRFSLEFVNVGDEQKFPKTSVCIILADLVYLESANIYTGPKIVRGLKRLRTTALEESADWALLSSFCDDSNLRISVFKLLHSTSEISKESITNFNRKSILRNSTHHQSLDLL